MLYNYLKALHIIFIVTWFAGMFYMPRLFIYATEANDKDPVTRDVLQSQFNVMMRRLWFGITWPSAVLTLYPWTLVYCGKADGGAVMAEGNAAWLIVKLAFCCAAICLSLFDSQYIQANQHWPISVEFKPT
jgi:putative membrane protein